MDRHGYRLIARDPADVDTDVDVDASADVDDTQKESENAKGHTVLDPKRPRVLLGSKRAWNPSVRDALDRRYIIDGNIVTRAKLVRHELGTIVRETHCQGVTPEQTLSRILQDIRNTGDIIFLLPGYYMRNTPVLSLKEKEYRKYRSKVERAFNKAAINYIKNNKKKTQGVKYEFNVPVIGCTHNGYQLYVDVLFQKLDKQCGVELDGVQHSRAVDLFGGVEGLKKQRILDKAKDQCFIKANQPLVRIGWLDHNEKKMYEWIGKIFDKYLS